jgi:hypothetical protein
MLPSFQAPAWKDDTKDDTVDTGAGVCTEQAPNTIKIKKFHNAVSRIILITF